MATFARARELCERLGDPPEHLQVMFWLTTASVIRGELPLAEETIAALLQIAEARGDRPALLNAMRGQAMIRLFMGHPTSALEVLERAIDAFNASSEEERLAARAAGQDAGVADLALMSWALWLLGGVDTAVAKLNTAIQRADAIDHPHSQAYACYYASVLHALRGETSAAQGYAERCLALSDEHGFRQWRGLAHAIRGICVTLLDPSSSALEEVRAALDEYRSAGHQLGITALYVLLCPALLIQSQIRGGAGSDRAGVCHGQPQQRTDIRGRTVSAEGARAARPRRTGRQEPRRKSLLEQALETARGQQARSLELRAASDLAALWNDQGRRDEARRSSCAGLCRVSEGFATQDVKQAKALLDGVRDTRSVSFALTVMALPTWLPSRSRYLNFSRIPSPSGSLFRFLVDKANLFVLGSSFGCPPHDTPAIACCVAALPNSRPLSRLL